MSHHFSRGIRCALRSRILTLSGTLVLGTLLLAATPACGTRASIRSEGTSVDLVSHRSIPIPAAPTSPGEALRDWDKVSLLQFEELLKIHVPLGTSTPLGDTFLKELRRALAQPGMRAVRAAILLGRSQTRSAGTQLLRQLRRRVGHEGRNQDAADVIAAGALERMSKGAFAAPRLALLAAGPKPHPDLEVRVACASAALFHGHDEVVPFLLEVLRIGSPAGSNVALEFDASTRSAWARTEAAKALSRRAKIENRYPVDGPLGNRDAFVLELEEQLGALVVR